MKRRIMSLLLVLCMVLTVMRMLVVDSQAATANEFIEKAKSQLGNTGSAFGFGDTNWCAYFMWWCANEVGMVKDGLFPSKNGSSNVRGRAEWFAIKGRYTSLYTKEENNRGGTDKGGAGWVNNCIVDNNYQPKVGDLVCFRNTGARWQHMGVVYKVDSSNVYVYHGSWGAVVAIQPKELETRPFLGQGRNLELKYVGT